MHCHSSNACQSYLSSTRWPIPWTASGTCARTTFRRYPHLSTWTIDRCSRKTDARLRLSVGEGWPKRGQSAKGSRRKKQQSESGSTRTLKRWWRRGSSKRNKELRICRRIRITTREEKSHIQRRKNRYSRTLLPASTWSHHHQHLASKETLPKTKRLKIFLRNPI